MGQLFDRWGRTVAGLRWWLLAGGVLLVVVGALWGTGVFGVLTSGGFQTPGSESARAATQITARLGGQDPDLIVLYSSAGATVDAAAVRDPVTATLTALRQRPEVGKVVDFYSTASSQLVSRDRHTTYAAITLRAAGDDAKQQAYEAIRAYLSAPGVDTTVGGAVALEDAADQQTERDITRGEAIAMPIVLILLVFVFRGLVAAGLPLLIGMLAVLGAFTTTRLIATITDVSTFAVNSITLLGLGMAIDYSLFMVSRFREELAAGHDTAVAVARTMTTAGRTVAVSGATIALALSSLLIFPQVFLRSMGIGGMAAVLVAMLGSLTVLPALLTILGPRVNALRIPVPRHHRREPTPSELDGRWARLSRAVMRRPVPILIGVVAVLAVLAAPFGHVRFGGSDERVLPAGTPARVVAQRLAADFPAGTTTSPIQVLVDNATPAQATDLAGRIGAVPGVTAARVSATAGDTTLISVGYTGQPTGNAAYSAVRSIRALPTPPGARMLVGGRPAQDVDLLASLGARLPWLALVMTAVALVVLFAAFGSVLLPVKAILMNLVSLGASFGVVVWVFQDGHLAGPLGFTPTGYLEPNLPILILAVLFGLATDYEVFLLSRIREHWQVTGDNTAAVATGMQRTGPIITAAALLLVVVVAGFTTGKLVFAKLIGIGMITAIVVDAALVRTLLVPATMRLLGRWNWWAPRPLAAAYRRMRWHDTGAAQTSSPAPADPELSR